MSTPGLAEEGPMVLWWQVGDENDYSEEGLSLKDVKVRGFDGSDFSTAYDLGANMARIREKTTGTYLNILDPETDEFSLESIDVPMVWAADVSAFSSSSPEYLFVIELGNYESGTWSTLAVSDARSYSDLHNDHFITTWDHGYAPEYGTAWNPMPYTVPEPDSWLLAALGAMLIALRRGRRGKAHA
ncbi:MAG: PEP-CTERM sorting domain-containing protein [Kiritimatiellae bacterium]|nr:PEP-CTERM sorting domain-containing protein [Kiritimatiellia bacterium]